MAFFMTKINTTGNNFSYLVFPLAATLSKFQQRRLGFLSAVFALQDNKFIFFKLSYFFRIWVCFCSQDINNFDNARGHYGEISPRQQPITARNFTVSNLCHIIIIIIIIIYIFIYIIIIILSCNNNIYHVIIIYIYIYYYYYYYYDIAMPYPDCTKLHWWAVEQRNTCL